MSANTPASLTILICTHNRAELLERVIASLNEAQCPPGGVRILVAANACTDDTVERMHAYRAACPADGKLPLEVLEVPTPGKSHALNAAIPTIESELIAFVDDDHRVDSGYLNAIVAAARQWPDAGLYCGRILPDWDGSEPEWVHDEGPYKIYPLPVPRYEQGDAPKTITAEKGPIPGGGNLVMRRAVFDLAGEFSTELGPHGHDLGGGEDSEYVLRAMARGVRCQYQPAMVQYHYVDNERLRVGYLLKKSYQRTRSTSRIHGNGKVPLYMWRKLAEYSFHSVFSVSWARRRFFWMRTAAALGEVQGRRESGHRGRGLDLPADRLTWMLWLTALAALAGTLLAWFGAGDQRWSAIAACGLVASTGTAALVVKSLVDFSQAGPVIKDEILAHYRRYGLFALTRLALWCFALLMFLGGGGLLLYGSLAVLLGWQWSFPAATLAALLGVILAGALQFIRLLRFNPGLLVASMSYRMSRFHPLWRWATAQRVRILVTGALALVSLLVLTALIKLMLAARYDLMVTLGGASLAYAAIVFWSVWQPEAKPARNRAQQTPSGKPHIVMIGSDTLRADRLGKLGYHRSTTPNIDALCERAALFSNCYVPCARTAPSLVSLFTGTWPHTHGIRDNFVADEDTRLRVDTLPQLLKAQGYVTAALSDWCGADLGKFSFGFDITDLPEDQWNLKYLMRQGPKDLRLFISAFTHNRFGRVFIPELFYLGGVPLTRDIGRRGRRLLTRLTEHDKPFLLNLFYSTTHPPFASEWPWYEKFTDPTYDGSSRFAMARLTDPFEIIRRQGEPREEFDLDQILDLYDGCVAHFDDEVGKMIQHLGDCGLLENTLIVLYSDHGMEFFEHETWGQGNSAVGDFSARVPLIISGPSVPSGHRVDQVIRTVDVLPTLLHLIGGPLVDCDGQTLRAAMENPQHDLHLCAFNETGIWVAKIPGLPDGHLSYPELLELLDVPDRAKGTLAIKQSFRLAALAAKDRMIRDGRWKLVFQPLENGTRLSLYDLIEDPGCTTNLAAKYPEVAENLHKKLLSWMEKDPVLSKKAH